jgi:hypothetical protein
VKDSREIHSADIGESSQNPTQTNVGSGQVDAPYLLPHVAAMSASAVLEGPIPHSYARIMLHAYYSDLHVYDEPAGPTAACSLREQARVGKPYSLLTRRSLAPTSFC